MGVGGATTGARRVGGLVRAGGRKLGEIVGEILGEGVLWALSCLVLAGVVVAVRWGWSHAPVVTVGVLGAVAGAICLGLVTLWGFVRGPGGPLGRRRPWATAALALTVVVAFWLSYVTMGCPACSP